LQLLVPVSDVIDQRSFAVINHFNLLMTGWGPSGPQPWNYFFRRDGVCESADAAAVFSAFVEDGFDSTRAAADAAFAPVWRLLDAM
jgi:hypothetical protein